MVNGQIETVHSDFEEKADVCSTSDAIVYLKSGSRVWVEMLNTGEMREDQFNRVSYFSGVLVNAFVYTG